MTPTQPDRRVRKTRAAIQQALVGLILEKGYDAVTVTDIIERADIGRSTFYAHFTDKHDVLDDSIRELGAFVRTHRDAGGGQLFGFSLAMFEHVHEQRHVLRALLGRGGGTAIQTRISQLLSDLLREELATLTTGEPPAVSIELIVTGVVGAYLALLSRWVDETEPHTPRDMDRAFRRLVLPGVRTLIGPVRASPGDRSGPESRTRG
jgi:AcrR family transcriptional regulator